MRIRIAQFVGKLPMLMVQWALELEGKEKTESVRGSEFELRPDAACHRI
jgi:hypothetical protein